MMEGDESKHSTEAIGETSLTNTEKETKQNVQSDKQDEELDSLLDSMNHQLTEYQYTRYFIDMIELINRLRLEKEGGNCVPHLIISNTFYLI